MHVLTLASLRGSAVRGPVLGAQHAYVLVRDWLGPPPLPLDPDVALAGLARRYLAGHGPASDRDLAKWAGLPLGQARRGLAAIAAELRDRPDDLAKLATGDRGDTSPPPPGCLAPTTRCCLAGQPEIRSSAASGDRDGKWAVPAVCAGRRRAAATGPRQAVRCSFAGSLRCLITSRPLSRPKPAMCNGS